MLWWGYLEGVDWIEGRLVDIFFTERTKKSPGAKALVGCSHCGAPMAGDVPVESQSESRSMYSTILTSIEILKL